ncbi:modular serine protease-like isoform X2 [Agrilus planipennis]|uniref:Modular serine protease-like isoform X2 n=1 Tax=Agrilus planipennis TaxID=224129 RepID=A0A1W4XIN2_AGRPL|nr:modular serine protease-like isoform X2 [Agrilus planipennis]
MSRSSSVYIYDKYTIGNLTRFKRQSGCTGSFEFQCRSGECISDDYYCDGKENCRDGSDETEDCKQIACLPHFFRCEYGACINGDFECDGKTDCKDNSDETSPKCLKVSQCGPNKFRCNSGQCISDYNRCDGKPDCYDKSDETSEVCRELNCPGFTFKCAYGACVAFTSKCNGRRDCADGSDEQGCKTVATTVTIPKVTTTTTKKPPIIVKDGCVLPDVPSNGGYNVSGLSRFSVGDVVGHLTILQYYCNSGYQLYPNRLYIVCMTNDRWDKEFPDCMRRCPSLAPTESTEVVCSLGNDSSKKMCENPIEGTIATFNCREFYERTDYLIKTTKCQGGSWNSYSIECTPACGKRGGIGQTNVVGGNIALKHDFPWHVGIYLSSDKTHICGGSIISSKFIVTAAHCLTNLETGDLKPTSEFLVKVGKHYREYDDPRDSKYTQNTIIKSISKHRSYRGQTQNHQADLAIIELQEPLKWTKYVQPICINWDPKYGNNDLGSDSGLVVGWGFTAETGAPADELKVLEVPHINFEKCYASVPDQFKPFVTPDKICAGFQKNGQSVCNGDSGGGLVFKKQYGYFGLRYILRGIVSVSPKSNVTNGCDSNSFAGYTDLTVEEYIRYIIITIS